MQCSRFTGQDRQPTSAYYLNIFDGTGSTGSTKAEGRSKGEENEQAPKKSADEIMAEANAEAAAMGLPPGFVRSTVTVTALTAAEEKAWDDEQSAAKAARKAVRDEKRRR